MFPINHFRQRIASKMIIAMLLVILIPTLLTSLSFYWVSTQTVKNNVRQSSIQIMKQATDSLSFVMDVASDTSDLLYSDTNIQQLAKNEGPWNQASDQDRFMTATLNNLVYSSSFVKMIYVLREEQDSWGSGTFSQPKLNQYTLSEFDWAQRAGEMDGELVWSGLQYDLFSGAGKRTDLVIPVVRVLKDFETLQNQGYIMVNLNGRDLLERIDAIQLGQSGTLFVVNEAGEFMIHDDLSLINKKIPNTELANWVIQRPEIEFEFSHRDIPYYGVKQRLSNGWLLVGVVPIQEITGQLDRLHENIWRSFLIYTFAAIIIGLFIASRVTKPIKQLTRQMKRVQEGDLTVRTQVHTLDEIGLMSRHFNKMLSRVSELMEQVKENDRKKQEAELRAVVHRINPHFLFNTLSTIRWLIKYNQSEQAYNGISALIRLLEANMGKKGNFITLAEELQIIEKYLVILELRYNLKFHLILDIDERAEDFMIPRMLIQPLVENAIFHGIVPRNQNGEITIQVRKRLAGIEMVITDNGIGMPVEKVELLNDPEQAIEEGWLGIGLKHVYESMQLYFDGSSRIQVDSREGEGTEIRILLMARQSS
ncbi:sensor histidine kinase [Marinicrinis sediminis]|uniref:histidine kinase n=1 Tax=Marinicrinis sediminis TaxID=1652465 RepID=A0ABW5R9A8_9BACL